MIRGKWFKGIALGMAGLFSVAYFGERIADRLTTTRIDNSSLALNYTYSSSPEFKENDCRQSLESTLASGFFDNSYLEEVLSEVSFSCKPKSAVGIHSVFLYLKADFTNAQNIKGISAQYIQSNRAILKIIEAESSRDQNDNSSFLPPTSTNINLSRICFAHEISHDFWNTRIDTEAKNSLQEKIVSLSNKNYEIEEEISEKLDCFDDYQECPSNFFKNKPLTKGQFTNLAYFSSYEYFYRNYYGESFDIEYYSDEAFAQLSQVVYLKYLDLKEEFYLKNPTKKASLDDKVFAKKAREIFKDNIPEEIRPFYKGLVDPRFFD